MTALPKIRRRIFFYLSLLVFFVTAPLILLYALGYRINIEQRGVEETGGIFVKTNLTGFTVFLNNGSIQKSSLLTRGLLLGNLPAGQYRLRVEKEGYQPWEKVVSVTQFSVREIRNIILLPDPLVKEKVATWSNKENLERAFVSPQEHYAAMILRDTTTQKRTLLFFETQKNKITTRFPVSAPVKEITWNTEENAALVTLEGQKQSIMHVSFLGSSPARVPFFEKAITISGNTDPRRVAQADIKKIRFGNEPNSFVILTDTEALLFWNTATTSATLLAKEVGEFEVLGDDVLFIAKNGFAARQSLQDGTTANFGRKGYTLTGAPVTIIRSQDGDIFFKDGADGLFFSSHENMGEFTLLETGVSGIALDGEEKKIFFRKQNAIGVFHLEDNQYQPFEKRSAKNILFESRDTTFLDAIWYTEDDAHIILNTSSGVFLLDTDIRGGPRIAELDAEVAEKIFWNQSKKKLYLIRDAGIETLAIE
ncbi:MAG: PEGA domain-containing protein [bacterium]|nr:PEGA domain-containing protein [bacterium]